MKKQREEFTENVIIIGAGPCGLSAALELQSIGLNPLLIEKNAVVHSIYQYPTYMHFFSTPELLEIGGIPFTTPNDKPTRREALQYYRDVVIRRQLRIHAYEDATSISRKENGTFVVETVHKSGDSRKYAAQHVVVATGYFDHPNLLRLMKNTAGIQTTTKRIARKSSGGTSSSPTRMATKLLPQMSATRTPRAAWRGRMDRVCGSRR